MPSKLAVLVILSFLFTPLFGLELQRGKMKILINEKNGRTSLFGTEDAAKPVWTSLAVTEDPTTTKWKLMIGDKTYVLGDDATFTTTVEVTPTGAKTVWTSKTVVATLTTDYLISANSTVADGVRFGLSVVNVSAFPVKVGVRWILDTLLGEKKDHFRLPGGEAINAESKIEGVFPDYYMSAGPAEDQPGLLVMLSKGATTPSRVFFANWKRLDDSVWDYTYKQGRDFNQLPYSFNDSAVAQFYDAAELGSGSTREVVVLAGLKSAKTMEGSRVGSANPLDDLLKKNQNPALSALDQDLVSLQTLLTQIDAKLADPARVTAEDLKLLQAVLDQMESKRKALDATKP